MDSRLGSIVQHTARPYLTETDINVLLSGTPNSRYGKIKRLLAKKELLHIRRGLYSLTKEANHLIKVHPYELAHYIYGPSYISLESALSYHQLIPETVYTITSVTTKRTKEFQTLLGTFGYMHLPPVGFYTNVALIQNNDYYFFMAKPWKAICDYVFLYKKDWKNLEPLCNSLRIDLDRLEPLQHTDRELLLEYYHSNRIDLFLRGITWVC